MRRRTAPSQARPVTGFADGWTEGVQLMIVGEKRMLWVPAALSFAAPGRPPPTTDVTIVVELLDILAGPKTPADVKAPPKDATVEKDGLATKVLTKGTGTVHPTRTQQRHGEVRGLDDRRKDVRLVVRARRAGDVRRVRRRSPAGPRRCS